MTIFFLKGSVQIFLGSKGLAPHFLVLFLRMRIQQQTRRPLCSTTPFHFQVSNLGREIYNNRHHSRVLFSFLNFFKLAFKALESLGIFISISIFHVVCDGCSCEARSVGPS